jgi:opacity protein-like surface antigen
MKLPMIAALVSLGATAANAADLSAPVVVEQPAFAGGWYLRGDIGFSNQNVGSLFNQNYSRYTSVQNVDKGFDAAPLFGLGIGYNINNWFRVDVTGEYRANANFHGLDIGYNPGPHDDNYTGSKSEWTFLLNGYVDLGTWYNFTPFVGAGVGMTRNTISNFRDTSESFSSTAYSDAASKWNFAWALYAGLGYQVTRNTTLELSYRYIDLGNATTGTMINYAGVADTPFEFRHLTSQDVRLGLRFNFAPGFEAPAPVQYFEPPPLHSKG